MKKLGRFVAAALLAQCVSAYAADLPPGVDPVQAGQELARELRSTRPSTNAEFTGTLLITKPGFTNRVPIECRIETHGPSWTVTYTTKPGGNQPAQRVSIKHAPDQQNIYVYAEGNDLSKTRQLKPEQLTLPLAGSDFYLMDLGLEFFNWPKQRLIKTEMRRSRSTRVLESTNTAPTPGSYSRVLSWIDVETDGLLRAEAYDTSNQQQKVFEVGSFKKIRGEWQLQDLRIQNPKAKTRTDLRFNFGEDAKPVKQSRQMIQAPVVCLLCYKSVGL